MMLMGQVFSPSMLLRQLVGRWTFISYICNDVRRSHDSTLCSLQSRPPDNRSTSVGCIHIAAEREVCWVVVLEVTVQQASF
uniref:Uncharacterized protein n=1 Tax=Physcomitrium patens TaxID=3218 RepID=A0A7I3ZCD6_PHYPA